MSRGREIGESSHSSPEGNGRDPVRRRTQDPPRDQSRPEAANREPRLRSEAFLQLRQAEREALLEIGRFRAVDARDLGLGAERLRALKSQGVIELRTIALNDGRRIQAVTLSKRTHRILQRRQGAAEQALHSGFQQSRQLAHDAALYRLYQHEAEKIRRQGGRVRRVVLDQELKRRLYSDLNRPGVRGNEAQRQWEAAEKHGLKVVNGKIPIPDVRIEYEAPDGREARVDLELVTDHYRSGQLAEKAQAGFQLYALGSSAGEGGSVHEERDRIVEILSI